MLFLLLFIYFDYWSHSGKGYIIGHLSSCSIVLITVPLGDRLNHQFIKNRFVFIMIFIKPWNLPFNLPWKRSQGILNSHWYSILYQFNPKYNINRESLITLLKSCFIASNIFSMNMRLVLKYSLIWNYYFI